MNASQFEARVLDRVHRVLGGDNVEDETIEIKSQWPPPNEAARAVAAMCNAAHGQAVVLLVGVDEKKREIVSVKPRDKSTWVPQFDSSFDGQVAPFVRHDILVPIGDRHVHALIFDSDRAPYVIRPSGEERTDVPFRVATRVVSARREHLLRILVPRSGVPELELVNASINLQSNRNHTLSIQIYCMPVPGHHVGLAAHRAVIEVYNATTVGHMTRERLATQETANLSFQFEGQSAAKTLTFDGPRLFSVSGTIGGDIPGDAGFVGLAFSVRPARLDVPAEFRAVLRRVHDSVFAFVPATNP